jgi:hypothetical protein
MKLRKLAKQLRNEAHDYSETMTKCATIMLAAQGLVRLKRKLGGF